jgi:hypothetical protein
MIAYKLVRLMADGSYAPLFINKTQRLPVGHWLEAGDHPTKGFAHRPGWHCTLKPDAPHLSNKGRVWLEVEIAGYTIHQRPESQGGKWALANRMKILGEL